MSLIISKETFSHASSRSDLWLSELLIDINGLWKVESDTFGTYLSEYGGTLDRIAPHKLRLFQNCSFSKSFGGTPLF